MSELRQNPATKEWVVISKERARRPDEFSETILKEKLPSYKENCPFCPGNEARTPTEIMSYRPAGTSPNSSGWWIRVIPNKFPALSLKAELDKFEKTNFFRSVDGYGEHEVVIDSPMHDQCFAMVGQKTAEEIFLAYRDRYTVLSSNPKLKICIIFKNHGLRAGTSIEHPHSQIISVPVVPVHIRQKLDEAMRFNDDTGECVYCKIIEEEKKDKERIILETDNFIAFVCFAARVPFETWILPKAHQSSFGCISVQETKEFAYITRLVLCKIYQGLNDPDYNYVIHSTPCHDMNEEYYHWHLKIFPRLTTQAGFELGSGMYINTSIPEDSAKFLREIHAL
jgi:UDPglucose--hexose-1-phosphate uridylyltransferase